MVVKLADRRVLQLVEHWVEREVLTRVKELAGMMAELKDAWKVEGWV